MTVALTSTFQCISQFGHMGYESSQSENMPIVSGVVDNLLDASFGRECTNWWTHQSIAKSEGAIMCHDKCYILSSFSTSGWVPACTQKVVAKCQNVVLYEPLFETVEALGCHHVPWHMGYESSQS